MNHVDGVLADERRGEHEDVRRRHRQHRATVAQPLPLGDRPQALADRHVSRSNTMRGAMARIASSLRFGSRHPSPRSGPGQAHLPGGSAARNPRAQERRRGPNALAGGLGPQFKVKLHFDESPSRWRCGASYALAEKGQAQDITPSPSRDVHVSVRALLECPLQINGLWTHIGKLCHSLCHDISAKTPRKRRRGACRRALRRLPPP